MAINTNQDSLKAAAIAAEALAGVAEQQDAARFLTKMDSALLELSTTNTGAAKLSKNSSSFLSNQSSRQENTPEDTGPSITMGNS